MRRLRAAATLLLLVLGAAAGAWVYYLSTPAGRGGAPRVVEIPPGRPLAAVARDLEAAGVIRHRRLFTLYAWSVGAAGRLKAGEYELAANLTPRQVLGRLLRGEVLQHRITIPEGSSVREIAALLAAAGLADEHAVLAKAEDPQFARALGVPADRLEGYLAPDTYYFARGIPPEAILRAMVARYRAMVTPALLEEAARQGLTEHRLVTLASIVEKETGRPEERPLVAAVFRNRLARGIPLQSDPTVIYGLERFDGNLRRADLLRWSPYNTYRIVGLPPGPIASPGLAAIEATLRPAPVDYLYFVSRNDGTHHFSRTLAEHERAVDRYQRRPARRGAPRAAR
ncbi:MAG TPA: endolytic transglycosylase MltG [Thermodesulfobacteriota bacterium]|nr:endolytic transglycosylase MltG [Thermodesulfobacteriota bacterium]